jgi:Zn-dependent protease
MMALFLGANERNPAKLGIWVAIVVVSVVVHELGHALMGKAFGLVPQIELHGMGGTTSFQSGVAPSRRSIGTAKSVAISLAGPFAGFLFALVVIAAQLAGFHPTHPLAGYALSLLFLVNVGWGIFNLLPMLPLDGGNVLYSVLTAVTKKNGEKAARVISIVVAAGIALLAIRREQWWSLYLGVLFAFRNFQALRQADQRRVDQALADAIERAYVAFDRKEWREVIGLLGPVLEAPASAELRQLGYRVYVAAMLSEGLWPEAMAIIERERGLFGTDELGRFAQTMRELGRGEDAARIEELGKPSAPLSEFRA